MSDDPIKRSCGSCRGCCKPFAIPEVGKHDADWCKHSAPGGGCKIYSTRPEACRLFVCGWLSGVGEESDRPDLLGVFITAEEFKLGEREVMIFHFWEIVDGGLDRPRVQELIRLNKEGGNIVALRRPAGASYDLRVFLPKQHFSPDEAELFDRTYEPNI